jgi:hypothetical protein
VWERIESAGQYARTGGPRGEPEEPNELERVAKADALFYARDADDVPTGWVARIKTSMATLVPRFTAERMLRDDVARMCEAPPSR